MIEGLKPYAEYKESGHRWLGSVPTHWSVLPNRAIFDEVKDRNHPREEMLSVTITRGIVRQKALLDLGLAALRDRMDVTPVAFHLLPRTFTLSELQEVYEILLGRRLHKASFRRALQAAYLVEPTDEWRSDGRGRPAQLFKFAPRKRRSHQVARRAVRFDLLGG